MTHTEFLTAIATLGLSRPQFARLAQTHLRTVHRWASGDSVVPGPVEALLRTWLVLKAAGIWPDVRQTVFHGVTT